jgi:hypothetical protein
MLPAVLPFHEEKYLPMKPSLPPKLLNNPFNQLPGPVGVHISTEKSPAVRKRDRGSGHGQNPLLLERRQLML